MGDKHTFTLFKALLFWAPSEMECLLTNPEGQAAKPAQMFPSARQGAVPVSCKKISAITNAGPALGSLLVGTSIHPGEEGSGQPCREERSMLALNFFVSPTYSCDLKKY